MKPRTISLLVVCCVVALGCRELSSLKGSGVSKTESREVSEFDQVELRGSGTLELTMGSSTPLSVTADDNILPVLTTKVDGRTLIIETSERIRPVIDIVIRGSTPNVKQVQCSGAATVRLSGIANDSLALELNGAGDILAKGHTGLLSVKMNGAGSLKADELQAKTAKLNLNGAGDADVHVTEALDVQVKGAADVRYKGDPKVTKNVFGAGSVSKRD